MNSPEIALDFGNSRLKALRRKGSALISETFDYGGGFARNLKSWLALSDGEKLTIAFSSVNTKSSDILYEKNFLPENTELLNAGEIISNFGGIDFTKTKGMGQDRQLGLIGAYCRARPPFITLDSGTASTVNAVNADSVCAGGAIFAGLRTQLVSLASNAEALGETGLFPPARAAGSDTEAALRSGIINSSAGGAVYIIRKIAKEEFGGASFSLFVTGGGASLIYDIIKGEFPFAQHIPGLVLEGLMGAGK